MKKKKTRFKFACVGLRIERSLNTVSEAPHPESLHMELILNILHVNEMLTNRGLN